jgi:hypothetical protein
MTKLLNLRIDVLPPPLLTASIIHILVVPYARDREEKQTRQGATGGRQRAP